MAQYGYPNPHKDPKTLPKKKKTLPKKKEKEKTTWQKIAEKFSGGSDAGKNRREQFQSYMGMIDKLQNQKFYFRNRVRATDPGERLTAQAGQIRDAKTTNMSDILDRYHDRALRLAQAKYYQKQTG